MYVAQIKGGKTIENVEHFTIKDGRVAAVRCYFGQQNSYPAAVVSGRIRVVGAELSHARLAAGGSGGDGALQDTSRP